MPSHFMWRHNKPESGDNKFGSYDVPNIFFVNWYSMKFKLRLFLAIFSTLLNSIDLIFNLFELTTDTNDEL